MKPAEAAALDRPWRVWASVIVVSVLLFSVLFGFLVIPIIQGYSAGIGAFTAMCRAVGISPGSPVVQLAPSEAKPQPTTRVAWSAALFQTLSHTTPAGAALAAGCAACHGQRGIAQNRQFPDLAGQSAVTIFKQLHDFKSGSRTNPLMSPMAAPLTDQQIIDVAAQFASYAKRIVDPSTPQSTDPRVVRLVSRGDPARAIPACNACHGVNAGGPVETPALSHQSAQYLAAQLQAFKSGARRNDIYGRMRTVAGKLSDQEIDALAQFYSTTSRY